MLSGILLALFAALLGAAFCFVGYRSFLVMLPIWGFFGGFWIGAMGTSLLLGSGFLGTTTGLVVGLVLGIIGAGAIHQVLKGWLNQLASGSASVTSTIGLLGRHDIAAEPLEG